MYKPTDGGPSHECDNCGAQLPPPDERGTRTCTFCRATYTAPQPAATPPTFNLVVNAPTATMTAGAEQVYTPTDFKPINEGKVKSGCGCVAWLIFLVVVASVGVPLYFGIKSGDIKLPNTKTYNFGASIELLPGEPSQPTNFITAASHYDGRSVWEVMRLNGSNAGSPAWATALPEDSEPALAVDGTNVYAASKTSLIALKLSDGTKAWEAKLTDEYPVFSACADCFSTFPGRVVIKTTDGTVQAFDSGTGAKVWSKDLDTPSDQIWKTATRLVILHESEAERFTKEFQALDPATGVVAATMNPACPDPERPDSIDHAGSSFASAHSTANPDSMYFAFGSSPGCMQLWNMATGEMTWSTYTPDTSYSYTSEFEIAEAADGSVLVTSRNDLAVVSPGGAEFRQVQHEENTEFHAMAVNEGIGIVTAKNTRGTTRTSIVGVELASGNNRWTVQLDKAQSIDIDKSHSSYSTNRDGTFTAHVSDNRLYVVEFFEGSSYDHTMTLLSFDALTGAPGAVTPMGGDSHDLIPDFGPAEWRGAQVTVRVGASVQTIDGASASKTFVFGS